MLSLIRNKWLNVVNNNELNLALLGLEIRYWVSLRATFC